MEHRKKGPQDEDSRSDLGSPGYRGSIEGASLGHRGGCAYFLAFLVFLCISCIFLHFLHFLGFVGLGGWGLGADGGKEHRKKGPQDADSRGDLGSPEYRGGIARASLRQRAVSCIFLHAWYFLVFS